MASPRKNSPELTDYRLSQVEKGMVETRREMVKLHAEHDTRFTQNESRLHNLEDFVVAQKSQGVPMKTVIAIATVCSILIGGILAAILKAAGVQ